MKREAAVNERALKRPDATPATTLVTDERLLSAIVLTYFILIFGLVTITAFLWKSPTVDEPQHLFAGYSHLKWRDFRANPEHPPLAKIWAALPLLSFEIKDPRPSSTHWDRIPEDKSGGLEASDHTAAMASKFLFADNDAESLFFYSKLQMIALGILLGIFVYLWSKELFGLEAAIASIFIYGLDPNIMAHSQIIHTDIPFSVFFFIATYFYWRAMRDLTWTNLACGSLFFGLAGITKYSFPAMVLVWVMLGVLKVCVFEPQRCHISTSRAISSRRGKAGLFLGILFIALITSYLFVWLAYGLRFDAMAGGNGHLPMDQVLPDSPWLKAFIQFLTNHRLFPEAWIYGQLFVFKYLERYAYLLGQVSDSGFWLYFPVAFAVKTPLPTLILFLTLVADLILKRTHRAPRLFLLIPVLVFFLLAILSRLNIGVRHILPIYPFLFVLIGGTAAELWQSKAKMKRGLCIFLGLWYLWANASVYPDYLAYFNELAGGPKNGHRVLVDSNLDWGQDLKGLKRWMHDHGVGKIRFVYFGSADPYYYGIDALYLPGSLIYHYSPDRKIPEMPSHVAISANFLYGMFLRNVTEEWKEFYKSLRWKEPVAVIGYSIYVYRLD